MSLLLMLAFFGLSAVQAAPADYTDSNAVQPYIESLKKKYDVKPKPLTEEASHSDVVKQAPPNENLEAKPVVTDPGEVQPYIEKLREKNGLSPAVHAGRSSNPDTVQPHIEALKKDSDLEPKYKKTVNMTAGFSVVASNQFNITSAKVQANSFNSVYSPDSKYAPSADIFVERSIYRNRNLGTIGIVGHFNVITIQGKGIFTQSGIQSTDTTFRFLAMPFSVGASYRFLGLRFIDPFISLSAVGIPFLETRNDDHPSRRGISRGYNVTGGLAFNLDWITRRDAWDMYDDNGVLHTYLITQLEFLRTISGPVNFSYNGTYVGLMFEF